jgi:hypothetical protein
LLPTGAAPSPHPRLTPSPPPHPLALNREVFLTLATGLPAAHPTRQSSKVLPSFLCISSLCAYPLRQKRSDWSLARSNRKSESRKRRWTWRGEMEMRFEEARRPDVSRRTAMRTTSSDPLTPPRRRPPIRATRTQRSVNSSLP